MRESAHLLGLASSSPFLAAMRKSAHLLACRGRCGIIDPAGDGAVPASGVAARGVA